MPLPDLVAACWTTAGACDPLTDEARSPVPVRTRIEAAAGAGFRGFGIHRGDLVHAEATLGLRELRLIFDANGITTVELELLDDKWYQSGPERAVSDHRRTALLRAAEVLNARHIKVYGRVFGEAFEPDRIAAELATFARQAEDAGTRLGVEPVAFTEIRTPDMALDVVRRADHPSAGVFLDLWHVARAGVDLDSMSAIPAALVTGVELADAAPEPRGGIVEDCVNHRAFPGEGSLDIDDFIDAVRRTGYRGPWGVELLSTEYRQLPLDVAVSHAYTSTAQFLAR